MTRGRPCTVCRLHANEILNTLGNGSPNLVGLLIGWALVDGRYREGKEQADRG
jgi:hypothetical protein